MDYILDAFSAGYVDKFTINECDVPGLLLMEHAAEAVVKEIVEKHGKDKKILCVAGKGNNGGDAAAVCRLLCDLGYNASCIVIVKGKIEKHTLEYLKEKVSVDLFIQLSTLKGLGIGFTILSDVIESGYNFLEDIEDEEKCTGKNKFTDINIIKYLEELGEFDIIVDGIFGTGLNKAPEGIYNEIIEYINSQREKGTVIYSVDIPSGVDASSGEILRNCIKADYTVTFGYRKSGQLLYPGRECCGKLFVHKIGFSDKALEKLHDNEHMYHTFFEKDIIKYMPKRFAASNKGSYGKAFLVAGSENMPGACVLAVKTALRTGCGLAAVCSVPEVLNVVASTVPEAVLVPLCEHSSDLRVSSIKAEQINNKYDTMLPELSAYTSCLVGPGLGKSERSCNIVKEMLSITTPLKGIVYDADAINIIADIMTTQNILTKEARIEFIEKNTPENSVFTPHKKELSRLLNVPMEELSSLFGTAKWLRNVTKRIWVLKDAATLVTGRGNLYINTSGNNGMSTAGAGDVLGGIIVSLLAQGSDVYTAACLGVYLHGLAGDQARDNYSEYGVMAGDISDEVAKIIKSLHSI